MKEHIVTIRCTQQELLGFLKDLHSQYKNQAGVEICVRYGTCSSHANPNLVEPAIWVYRIGGKSIYQGTHADQYHQDVVGEAA